MTRCIRLFLLFSITSLLLAGLFPTRTALAQSDNRSAVLAQVNGLRSNSGLSPWRYNAQLAAAAQEQANWMAATGQYLHSHGGSSPYSRSVNAGYRGYVSEIIVGGYELTPYGGLQWWLNSAVHYNIMVSTRYTEAGSGYAINGTQHYYVIVVGQPNNNVDARRASTEAVPEPIRVVPIEIAAPREDGAIVHVVQGGQTAWAIAARYEVDLAELLWINDLSDGDFVRPGDEILVRPPDGWVPPPTPTPPMSHIVKQGQTLWTIAALYKLTLDDLLWLNDISADTLITPGDELLVRFAPGQVRPPTPTPTPVQRHVVEEGQTLWSVAAWYGLSLEQLLAFNALNGNSIIRPGDELWVIAPVTPAPTATATPIPAVAAVVVEEGGEDSAETTPQPPPTATATTPQPTVVSTSTPIPTEPIITNSAGLMPESNWLLLALTATCLVSAAVLLLRR